MNYSILKKKNIQPGIWDGGKTFEYFIYPENSTYSERDFLFRISSASIDKVPSDFTRFSGFQRYLLMLDGFLEIIHNGSEEVYSEEEIFEFDSDDSIVSKSSGSDFNLMVAKSVHFSSVEILSETKEINSGFIFLFAINQTEISLENQKIHLEENDLLIIENSANELIRIHSDSKIILSVVEFL